MRKAIEVKHVHTSRTLIPAVTDIHGTWYYLSPNYKPENIHRDFPVGGITVIEKGKVYWRLAKKK